MSEGQKIWRNFQRFADYEDLKELYRKVIPEISKFEERLIEFQIQFEKNAAIICNFDRDIALKADKLQVENLYDYLDGRFTQR